jgi:hypothetical protein
VNPPEHPGRGPEGQAWLWTLMTFVTLLSMIGIFIGASQ